MDKSIIRVEDSYKLKYPMVSGGSGLVNGKRCEYSDYEIPTYVVNTISGPKYFVGLNEFPTLMVARKRWKLMNKHLNA